MRRSTKGSMSLFEISHIPPSSGKTSTAYSRKAPSQKASWLSGLQVTLDATVDYLARIGVRPNLLTYLSIAPAFVSLAAVATQHFNVAVLMMLFSGLCDLLDGPLARRSGQTSIFGALLDSSLDRFADAAPMLGLVYVYAHYPLAAMAVAGSVFAGYSVSYVRARAEGLKIALPWLWMRRTERLILTGAGLLLAPISIPGLDVPAPVTLMLVCSVGGLSLLAAMHALLAAARILEKSPVVEIKSAGR